MLSQKSLRFSGVNGRRLAMMLLAVVTQRQDKPTRREIYLHQCGHGRLGKYTMFLVLLGDVCQVSVTAV